MCPCNLSFDHGATYDFCRVTLVFSIRERSEPLRDRLLSAFRPDELDALVGLLNRIAEAMTPLANNSSAGR